MNSKILFSELHSSWAQGLQPQFEQNYMNQLCEFLSQEIDAGKIIYPESKNIFNAFNSTSLSEIKVVVLGQDPYHGPGQAHGLCFSVQKGVKIPPSLKNIFKELERDLGCKLPAHGSLQAWASQGVLLLNTTLTVEEGMAGSHQGKGWELLTDEVIKLINIQCEAVVFMLWGSYAQKKVSLINEKKHLILCAPHPSPLSAYRGFIGCGHFSTANEFILRQGGTPIDWCLS